MMSSSTVGGIWPCATATRTSGTCLSRNSLTPARSSMRGHDIERLAAAVALAQQRLAHHQRIERRDEGAHRQPVDRRRGDDREVAHAGQRELQGARDRRRGQRQHMHLGAQLLEPLLVGDAEMLLLVDDDEAEVLELDGLAEQRVGADRRCRSGRRRGPSSTLRQLRRRSPAARPARPCTGKPRKRSVKVLVCWRASSVVGTTTATCLPFIAVDEGRAQRHLGLAEADVAADQPVHRPAGGEIVEHRVDRGLLVLGLLVGEAGAELVVGAVARRRAAALRAASRSAAILISSSAISRMRLFIRALRACQPPPPSRSSSTPVSSEP